MSKKAKILSIILPLIVISLGIFLYLNYQPKNGLVLFFSPDCPHCQNVEKFLDENNIEEKLKIDQKNVSVGLNSNLLLKKAEICDIPREQVGIPFLWDGESQKCYLGDVNIIDFLTEKTK